MKIQAVLNEQGGMVAFALAVVFGAQGLSRPASAERKRPAGRITFIQGEEHQEREFHYFTGDLYAMNPDGTAITLLKNRERRALIPTGVES